MSVCGGGEEGGEGSQCLPVERQDADGQQRAVDLGIPNFVVVRHKPLNTMPGYEGRGYAGVRGLFPGYEQ